jgi:hypothetical protein
MHSNIIKVAMSNNHRTSIKTSFLVPAVILIAVSFVMPSEARPHHDQARPVKSSSQVYSQYEGRRDSSCFNIPGIPDPYACSTSN